MRNLSRIAGVSARTLRYYDEIGLLKPARINSSGYRIYGREQVDRLQQILFYRELGVSLENIGAIIDAPCFDEAEALRRHRAKLLAERERLDLLLANIGKTIAAKERRIEMSDMEKFEGFKKKLIENNEKKYGQEAREKYGAMTVDASNSKLRKMTEAEYEAVNRLGQEVLAALSEAFRTGDAAGGPAQKAADLHRKWLSFYWASYTKEAHAGIAEMYAADERFKAYYDKEQPGAAEFLRDAILIYTGMKK